MDPKRLAKARTDAKLTQQQIADEIGMKQQAYARLERHPYDCRLSTLEKIAKATGVALVDLLAPATPRRK